MKLFPSDLEATTYLFSNAEQCEYRIIFALANYILIPSLITLITGSLCQPISETKIQI